MSNSNVQQLQEYGLPPVYVDHLIDDRDVNQIWQTQREALEEGLLGEENFLVIAEPGTGKTLAAEFAIIERAAYGDTCAFLVPYRALAEEKEEQFRDTVGEELDLVVKSSLGGERYEPGELFSADILIMTYEKFDYHLRNHESHITNLGAVVIDEFHTLGKSERGPKLEIVTTRLITDYPDIRIIGLSATTPNAEEVAQWLNASYSDSGSWRKCPLHEGVYVESNREVILDTGDSQSREDIGDYYDDPDDPAHNYQESIDPLVEYLGRANERQCLVFAPTRDKAEAIAARVREYQIERNRSTPIDVSGVNTTRLQNDIEETVNISTDTIDELSNCVNHGVGFHHAGLPDRIKQKVTQGFEDGTLRAIVSTTSLGAGINLPVDRVFITKPRIGSDNDEYGRDMLVGEYKNLAGRAGRPQYGDDPGEAILYSPNPLRRSTLLTQYVDGDIEEVESEINFEDEELVLNLLRDCSSIESLMVYIQNSFLGESANLEEQSAKDTLEQSLRSLEGSNMIAGINSGEVELTALGNATSKQLIDPATVSRSCEYLQMVDPDEFDRVEFLLVLAAGPLLSMNRVYSWKDFDLEEVRRELPVPNGIEDDDLRNAISTALVVDAWIADEDLDEVFNDLQIAKSRTSADVTERAAPLLARGTKVVREIISEADEELESAYGEMLDQLESKVRHGLDDELVPFAEYGITSDRNVITHLRENIGIEHPEDIATGSITTLFGELGYKQAYQFTRNAINEFCERPERERKHTLLDAREIGPGVSEIEELFESSETEFENRCEEFLGDLSGTIYDSHDEQVRKKIAEGTLHLLDDTGEDVHEVDSTPVRIAVECKSKQDHSEKIDPDDATAVVQKANSEENFLLTVGNPGFEDDAIDAAERQSVLLLPAAAFATLVIYADENNYRPEVYAEIFTEEGLLSRPDILEILDEW